MDFWKLDGGRGRHLNVLFRLCFCCLFQSNSLTRNRVRDFYVPDLVRNDPARLNAEPLRRRWNEQTQGENAGDTPILA